jgi:group I intron endonuclease
MKYTIYKTTNKINNKVYIGKHQTLNPHDNYIGSGKALEEAIKKYGKSSFSKEVLFIFDTEAEMNDKEKELVNESFISTNLTYNMGVGGEGGSHFSGRRHSDETKEKIKEKRKNQIFSEETKKKISEANRNRIVTKETKLKLSEKGKLRFKNEEARKKHSELMTEYYKK